MRAIAAVDNDWGIGRDGLLPWRLPGDLAFFKKQTMGSVVVMGRRTFESLSPGASPSPLPGRTNIVLTRDAGYAPDGVTVARSIGDLIGLVGGAGRLSPSASSASSGPRAGSPDACGVAADVYVCGGAEIYRLLMPYTETCLITRVDASFGADAFFPDLNAEVFTGPSGEKKRYVLASESAAVTENDLASGRAVTYRFCEYRATY
jgi:dihydrofolate reductase